jgi:uncharacterized protein YhbP (UPF0306 family)
MSIDVGSEHADVKRVVDILSRGKYLTLGVADNDGPWVATVRFSLAGRRQLLFNSPRTSRHGYALMGGGEVAGSIFYDDASGVDGLQFSVSGTLISGSMVGEGWHDVEAAYHTYRSGAISTEADRASWDRSIEEFCDGGRRAFYVVDVSQLWVIDREHYRVEKIDRRSWVEVDAVWERLGD